MNDPLAVVTLWMAQLISFATCHEPTISKRHFAGHALFFEKKQLEVGISKASKKHVM